MTTTSPLLHNSTVEGWEDISTAGGHVQLTATFINDVAGILENLTTKGQIGRLLMIKDMLMRHVSDQEEHPHNFSMEYFRIELIQSLYKAYRLNGATGSLEDMFAAMFQHIPILTYSEAHAGVEDTKAVSAPKFKHKWLQHAEDLDSHYGIMVDFMPRKVFPHTPTVSIIDRYVGYPAYSRYFSSEGYVYPIALDGWNPYSGTILFAFRHVETTELQGLWQLDCGNNKYYYCYLDVDQCIYISRTGFGPVPEILAAIPMEAPTGGNKKLVLSYTKDKMIFRSTIGAMITLEGTFEVSGEIISIRAPFLDEVGKCRTRQFIYYPYSAKTEEELIFLLN